MNKSYFIMSKFAENNGSNVRHLEATCMDDAINFMVEEHGIDWSKDYMLFEGNQVFNY